jgi:hypothetical protein
VYNGARVQSTVAMLELAGDQGRERPPHNMLLFQMQNAKPKPRQFSLILLPFAHHANGSLLFVHLLTKKKSKLICKLTKQTKRTCPSMPILSVMILLQLLFTAVENLTKTLLDFTKSN